MGEVLGNGDGPMSTHYHTCPGCHCRHRCDQNCTIEPEFEYRDGMPGGFHEPCLVCQPIEVPDSERRVHVESAQLLSAHPLTPRTIAFATTPQLTLAAATAAVLQHARTLTATPYRCDLRAGTPEAHKAAAAWEGAWGSLVLALADYDAVVAKELADEAEERRVK